MLGASPELGSWMNWFSISSGIDAPVAILALTRFRPSSGLWNRRQTSLQFQMRCNYEAKLLVLRRSVKLKHTEREDCDVFVCFSVSKRLQSLSLQAITMTQQLTQRSLSWWQLYCLLSPMPMPCLHVRSFQVCRHFAATVLIMEQASHAYTELSWQNGVCTLL